MRRVFDDAVQREVRAISRKYRREGYRVTTPDKGGQLPSFLEGLKPNLIAESPTDHVVIEVKQSSALRGANELQAIAERVSRQPGWRFELVAVKGREEVAVPAPEQMDQIVNRARQVMSEGYTDLAYTYACTAVDVLVNGLAQGNGLKTAGSSTPRIAHDLATLGVISEDAFKAVERSWALRNGALHTHGSAQPEPADVEHVLSLARELRNELAAAA